MSEETKISVVYIDHMGSDKGVVNAARVSFSNDDQNVVLDSRDEKLIVYLAKHNHWSPFAHNSIQFKITCPIFIARQLVKHQVGGVWNEVSRRYVDYTPNMFVPSVWRGRPKNAKQGSNGVIENQKEAHDALEKHHANCVTLYNNMLSLGICPEQARIVLPLSSMTEWYWTGSLVFWARVCKQRIDLHAQEEAREVAILISDHCKKLFPLSWDALMG